jgi:thiol-disulfide isomerase/thioredoxin
VQLTPAESQTPQRSPEKELAGKPTVTVQVLSWNETQKLVVGRKGKVVVVDVWSTFCEPCLREFPNLVKLSEKFGDRAACISFNVDYDGSASDPPASYREPVLKFLTTQQAHFQNVISSDPNEDFFNRIKLGGPPAVFVYDRTGKLAHRFDNSDSKQPEFTYEKDVVPLVEKLLTGP